MVTLYFVATFVHNMACEKKSFQCDVMLEIRV